MVRLTVYPYMLFYSYVQDIYYLADVSMQPLIWADPSFSGTMQQTELR